MMKRKIQTLIIFILLSMFFLTGCMNSSDKQKAENVQKTQTNIAEEPQIMETEIKTETETPNQPTVTDFVIEDCFYDVEGDGDLEIVRLRAKVNAEDTSKDETGWLDNTWLGQSWYKEDVYLDIIDYRTGEIISEPLNHRIGNSYNDDGYVVVGMEQIYMSGIELLCIHFRNVGNRMMSQIRLLQYDKDKQEWIDYFEQYSAALEYRVYLLDNYIGQIFVNDEFLGELDLSALSNRDYCLGPYYEENGKVKEGKELQEDWHFNGSGFYDIKLVYDENADCKIIGKKRIFVGGSAVGWLIGEYQMDNGTISCQYRIEEYHES